MAFAFCHTLTVLFYSAFSRWICNTKKYDWPLREDFWIGKASKIKLGKKAVCINMDVSGRLDQLKMGEIIPLDLTGNWSKIAFCLNFDHIDVNERKV